MQIANSKFHKVWKVTLENGFKKVDLGDSRKLKDGGFENWSWFGVSLVGNAKNVHIDEGDTITIISGQVQKRKYEGKFYDNVVIFDLDRIYDKATYDDPHQISEGLEYVIVNGVIVVEKDKQNENLPGRVLRFKS